MKKIYSSNYISAFCVLIGALSLLTSCNNSEMSDAPEMNQSSVSENKSLMSRIADNSLVRTGTDDVIMNAKNEEDAHKRLAELISPFSVTSSRRENNEEEYTVTDATGTYKIVYLSAPDDPDYFSYALVRNSANQTLKTIKFGVLSRLSSNSVNLWDRVCLPLSDIKISGKTETENEHWKAYEPNALCIKKNGSTVTILYLSKNEYEATNLGSLLKRPQMNELGEYLRANRTVFEDRWNHGISNNNVDFDKMYWLGEKCCLWDSQRRTQNLNGKQSYDVFVFVNHPYLLVKEYSTDKLSACSYGGGMVLGLK